MKNALQIIMLIGFGILAAWFVIELVRWSVNRLERVKRLADVRPKGMIGFKQLPPEPLGI